tara:strand:- start:729 stop:1853 length:1125 start_codon:yes stop_codon:yes gene_type:complete
MEIKVRDVSGSEEKSQQEIEQGLLQKHEEKLEGEVRIDTSRLDVVPTSKEDKVVEEKTTESETASEMSDEDVLLYLKNRYNKQIDSVEQLFEEREQAEDLPEDVAAYLNYKKETGRGINDYVSLNKDFDEMKPDKVLREYLVATEKGLDAEDIDTLMEAYAYDDDLDDESTIKKTKLSKKKAIAKARDYFESEKEKYRMPLESGGSSFSKEDSENLESYRQYVKESDTYNEELKRKQEWFLKKTDEVFGSEFKGFEFAIDEDKTVTFSPGDAAELKKIQSNSANFIGKYMGEDGLINDAVGYHRAMAIAMNPERFAKFFYEQGKSIQADDTMRKMKNTDMSMRTTPEVTNKGGMQVKSLTPDSGRGLKIRSRKH